jgi:hypothetical protein
MPPRPKARPRAQPSLNTIYHDPLQGFNRGNFTRIALSHGYTKPEINKFLDNLSTEQQFHKRLKLQRLPILNLVKNQTWEVDLIDYSDPMYTGANYSWRYVLVVIDQNTRYVWTARLKTKESKENTRRTPEILQAFEAIIDEANTNPDDPCPHYLLSDKGLEFKGQFKKYLDHGSINHITKYDHGPHVERVNHTLKNMIGRYWNSHNTYRWYNILDKITKNYNNSYHSSLGDTPYNVYHNESAHKAANARMIEHRE